MHLWDDKKGYLIIPYKKYAYVKNTNGQHVSLYGDRVKKVFNYDKDDPTLHESDVPPTTRFLVDQYTDSDEVSDGHRKVFFDIAKKSLNDPAWDSADVTVAQELLRPSVIYTPTILKILEHHPIKSIAHITGGGLPGNINRVLPPHTDAEILKESWVPPKIFTEIQLLGNIEQDEMYKVFNMGIGMTLIVDQQSAESTQKVIESTGLSSTQIGTIRASGTGSVQII